MTDDARAILSTLYGADAVESVADLTPPGRSAAFSSVTAADVRLDGDVTRVVVRMSSPDGPWQSPEDAARQLMWYARVSGLPRHPRVLTMAFRDGSGRWHRATEAPMVAVVEEFVAGQPYADDLARIRTTRKVTAQDHDRALVLAGYLADIHRDRVRDDAAYLRGLRELVGGMEGIMSVVSLYPPAFRAAHRELLGSLQTAVAARAVDQQSAVRPVATVHGDFHPGNILFAGDAVAVVDRGRIERDEAAVDVGAALINYIALALIEPDVREPARELARTFLAGYLDASGDVGLPAVLSVHTAMRAAAVASPTFYPDLGMQARIRVLRAGVVIAGEPVLNPDVVDRCIETLGGRP